MSEVGCNEVELATPERGSHPELVGGELYASPRPAPRHSYATMVLSGHLEGPFNRGQGGPGGWLLLYEPEFHLRQDVLVPDLAGWRRERLPELPDTAHLALAPDWVCEVLSPSGHQWLLLDTHVGAKPVQAPPFDSVVLELGAVWAR